MKNYNELTNKLDEQVSAMMKDIKELNTKLDDLESKAKQAKALCNEIHKDQMQSQHKKAKPTFKVSFAPIDSLKDVEELKFSNIEEAESALCTYHGQIGKRLRGELKSFSFNTTYKGKEGIAVIQPTPRVVLP